MGALRRVWLCNGRLQLTWLAPLVPAHPAPPPWDGLPWYYYYYYYGLRHQSEHCLLVEHFTVYAAYFVAHA